MKVILHPAAEQDLFEAAAFYEKEGSPALAARFIAEFKRSSALLTDHPKIGVPRSGQRRGLSMNIFPYTIIYRPEKDEIRILVIKHNNRRPGFGSSRF